MGEESEWVADPLLTDLAQRVRELEQRRRSRAEEMRDVRDEGEGLGRPDS
jgi:hypothetical protein